MMRKISPAGGKKKKVVPLHLTLLQIDFKRPFSNSFPDFFFSPHQELVFLHAVPPSNIHRSLHEREVHCQLPAALCERSSRLPEDHVSTPYKATGGNRIFCEVSK